MHIQVECGSFTRALKKLITRPGAQASSIPDKPKRRIISDREDAFITNYIATKKKAASAAAAGWANSVAPVVASNLLADPRIRNEIDRRLQISREKIEFLFEDALRYWHELAYADSRELLPVRHSSCRYCWGIDFQYQFTLNEMRHARRKHFGEQLKKPERDRKPFDELGGDGYNALREPHPDCPECFGRGVFTSDVIDFDTLSTGSRRLIKNIKFTKDGSVELGLHDQFRAMENLQVLVGYMDKKDGRGSNLDPSSMTDEELISEIEKLKQRRAESEHLSRPQTPLIEGSVALKED